MFDCKGKDGGVAFEFFDLAVDVILVVREALAKIHHQLVRPVVDNANASEYNYASYVERPMAVLAIAFVVNAKGDLVA